MKFDLHIHSKYSKDSFLEPKIILKIGKIKGLSGVAVTDHNTIKGGVVTQKINTDKDFDVIVGAEIKTEYGDIICLFLQEEIKSRKFLEMADEVKDQDGILILAHPFRKGIVFPSKIFNKINVVEAFNARSPAKLNKKAFELATIKGKTMTAGSDAHLGFEVGRGITIVDNDIRGDLDKGNTSIEGNEGNEANYYLSHVLSFLIEIVKQ